MPIMMSEADLQNILDKNLKSYDDASILLASNMRAKADFILNRLKKTNE